MARPQDPHDLPAEVVRFIQDRIDSVPELEALLLLQETSPRVWTGAEIWHRLYVSEREAGSILSKFGRLNLVTAGPEDGTFRFNSGSGEAELVERVGKAYRTHLAIIAGMIHAKPALALREFARAFNVKTEKPT